MSAIIASFWPYIVSAFLGLSGVVFGIFRHAQASKTEAQAKEKVAVADTAIAQKQSQLDTANTAAAVATEQAVSNRSSADAVAASADASNIDAQLAAIGALRKD